MAVSEAADVVIADAAQHKLIPIMLGQMLVTAGRSIADEDDLLTVLQRVAETAHEVIDGADSTGVTIDFGGRIYPQSIPTNAPSESTANNTMPATALAYTRPAPEPSSSSTRHRRRPLAAVRRGRRRRRNPQFPGRTSARRRPTPGIVQPLRRNRSAFDTIDAEILDLLSATVSRTIGDYARFKSASDVAETIQRALATRGPIEQAKGMLMAIHGINADQAFDRLRSQSQNTNTPLSSAATTFVEHIKATNPSSDNQR
jgi:hypothetical protein